MTIEETITSAWFDLLNGSVTVAGYLFPVYRTNAPESETSHYILLRKESGSFNWNKSSSFRTFVLIVEIVTVWGVIINDKLVDDADEVIRGIAFNTPPSNNLGVAGLIKVDPGTPIYIDEDDGSVKYYRKATRFNHQTNL